MQQFAYTRRKNATDSALIIDAMDLLFAGNVDGFVIVSSDSDFTRLATRLRESGKTAGRDHRHREGQRLVARLGEVGSYLGARNPGFDVRAYGFVKLGDLVRAQPYVEVRDVGGSTGPSVLHVRLKPCSGRNR